jgi:hypothetical protein
MDRREYRIKITVNNRRIKKVIIDPHYELKHSSSVNDKVILELVELLDGGIFPVQDRVEAYEYYVADKLKLSGKYYKLVWLLEDNQIYIGVINAHRRR